MPGEPTKRANHCRGQQGWKTRTIDLHNEARRALYNYIYEADYTRRDARDPDSAYVFTSQRAAWLRQQGRPDHLTVRGVEHIWTTVKQQARQDEYELAAFDRLQDGLRAGDISVAGSHRYQAFDDYLLLRQEWERLKKKNRRAWLFLMTPKPTWKRARNR